MGINRTVLQETRARSAQPCAHPKTTTIAREVVRRVEKGGGDIGTLSGYAGRHEPLWCLDCGHTLTAAEVGAVRRRTARQRFAWRLSVAIVCSVAVLGMGYVLGQGLDGSNWDTGGWLANWFSGTLFLVIAALFGLSLSHAFGSQPD